MAQIDTKKLEAVIICFRTLLQIKKEEEGFDALEDATQMLLQALDDFNSSIDPHTSAAFASKAAETIQKLKALRSL